MFSGIFKCILFIYISSCFYENVSDNMYCCIHYYIYNKNINKSIIYKETRLNIINKY